MNEIVHKFLLAGDEMKLMSEMNWMQPEFAYSACGPYKKIKKEYKSFEKQDSIKLVFKMTWLMVILKI